MCILKAIKTTVLKLEETTEACSAKKISTKFLFNSLPARFVSKIFLKFNFKAEVLRLCSYLYKISETIEEDLF